MSVREALRNSIERWINIRDSDTLEKMDREFTGSNCDLCLVHNKEDDECTGCPVAAYTGAAQCKRTPYYRFIGSLQIGHNYEESKISARRMVKLLEETEKYLDDE